MTGLNMRVALLALPGSMRSALAGLADMFWLANQVVRMNPTVNPELSRDVPLFDVRTITADGQPVRDCLLYTSSRRKAAIFLSAMRER